VGDEHKRRLLIRQSLPPRKNPYESLRVCGRCFVLFGGEGLERDLYSCTPLGERRKFYDAVSETTGSAWHKHYELCRCCASGIVAAVFAAAGTVAARFSNNVSFVVGAGWLWAGTDAAFMISVLFAFAEPVNGLALAVSLYSPHAWHLSFL
jgi:hypothetical protein